jgi:hypothetical protein
MHKQKVLPGCSFPYADLARGFGRCIRFPPICRGAKAAGKKGNNPSRSERAWPWESRKESLMLRGSSQNMTIGPMEGEAIDVSGR